MDKKSILKKWGYENGFPASGQDPIRAVFNLYEAMDEYASKFKNKETIEFVRQGCEAFKNNHELREALDKIRTIACTGYISDNMNRIIQIATPLINKTK